jgi:hypothetical protein
MKIFLFASIFFLPFSAISQTNENYKTIISNYVKSKANEPMSYKPLEFQNIKLQTLEKDITISNQLLQVEYVVRRKISLVEKLIPLLQKSKEFNESDLLKSLKALKEIETLNLQNCKNYFSLQNKLDSSLYKTLIAIRSSEIRNNNDVQEILVYLEGTNARTLIETENLFKILNKYNLRFEDLDFEKERKLLIYHKFEKKNSKGDLQIYSLIFFLNDKGELISVK